MVSPIYSRPERQRTTDGISKSDLRVVANPQTHCPGQNSRRDQSLDHVEFAQTPSAQRQLPEVLSTQQSKPPHRSDLNARKKDAQKKDHAVVALDSRITKMNTSRPASNSVRASNSSKNTARRPSLQVAPNKDTAAVGSRASNTLDFPRKFIVGLARR